MKHVLGIKGRFRVRSRGRQCGFTLAEAIIAVAISAITLGGVMVLNAQQLKLVRSTRQSNAVSMALQDRVEQLRLTAWANLTNTAWLKTHVFDRVPDCAQVLPNYTETVTLTTLGGSSTARMEIVNKANGQFSVISDGSQMAKKRQGRIDVVVSWEGADKRIRERSYATIVSNGGITRVGLMGMGGAASGDTSGTAGDPTTPTTPGDPNGSSTPSDPTSPSNSTEPTSPNTSPNQGEESGDKIRRGSAGGKKGVG